MILLALLACGGPTTRDLADAARLRIAGNQPLQYIGTEIACSDQPVGEFATALVLGTAEGEESFAHGARLFDGRARGKKTLADASWKVNKRGSLLGSALSFVGRGPDRYLLVAAPWADMDLQQVPSYRAGVSYLFRPQQNTRVSTRDAELVLHGEANELIADDALAADLDGDGLDDLILVSLFGPDPMVLFYRGDSLDQDPRPVRRIDGQYFGSQVVDLTGDGVVDLVMALWQDTLIVRGPLLGPGEMSAPELLIEDAFPFPSGLLVGDLDGDGVPDLVLTDKGGEVIYVFSGPLEGPLRVEDAQIILPPAPTRSDVYVYQIPSLLDFNGDGQLDLVVMTAFGLEHPDPDNVAIYPGPLSHGKLSSRDAALVFEDEDLARNRVQILGCDLNQDGRDELIVSAVSYDNNTGAVYVVDGTPWPRRQRRRVRRR